MEITYDLIKPIILEEKAENSTMVCKFQVEGEVFEGKGNIRIDSKDTSSKVKNMVRRTVMSRMRSSLMRMVRGAVGGGMAGNIASMAGNEVVRANTSHNSFSAAEKKAAVVKAFERVAFNFYYDEDSRSWKIARRLSEFEKRLKATPLSSAYDKKTLARMLIEMAKADGQIAAEEKEFFQSFLDDDTGSFAQVMREAPLSRVELEEVSAEGRENIFMITVAVALSDKDFDQSEKDKLYEYAEMMSFEEKKRDDLIKLAQDYTIENAIHASGNMSREEIYRFADQIGMDRSEAERAQIRMSKRLG